MIPVLGRSPGEGEGYPLQYSGLENSMDCIVHEVPESDTTERLSLFTFSSIATSSPCSEGLVGWTCRPLVRSLAFCALKWKEEIKAQRNEGTLPEVPGLFRDKSQAKFSVFRDPILFTNGFNLFMFIPGDKSFDVQEKMNS